MGKASTDPPARCLVDLNIGLRFCHRYAPQTSFKTLSQLRPITRLMRDDFQPFLCIADVIFGHSPILRIPSGLTIFPKSVRRRAYPLSRVIQSKNSRPNPCVKSVPIPTLSSPQIPI